MSYEEVVVCPMRKWLYVLQDVDEDSSKAQPTEEEAELQESSPESPQHHAPSPSSTPRSSSPTPSTGSESSSVAEASRSRKPSPPPCSMGEKVSPRSSVLW